MKLTFIILTFLSINAWADTIAEYAGPIFKADQLTQCEVQFASVLERVEATKKIKMVEGGCIDLSNDTYQLKFSYVRSALNGIKKFERKSATDQECRSMIANAPKAFEAAGYQFINAYCSYGRVTVDYFSEKSTSIRNIIAPFSFANAADCEKSISTIKTKIAPYKISDILWSCDLVTTFGGAKGFIPTLSVSSIYSTSVKFLKGKNLQANAACFENRADVARSFEASKTNVLSLFCANKTYTEDAFEVIAYVEEEGPSLVRSYEGMTYASLATCETQLVRATANIESKDTRALYSFCEIEGKTYRPVIHYAETFQVQ